MVMIRCLLLIAIAMHFLPKVIASELILPAEFRNNQIYLTPTLLNNKTITFFTDTGGGWNVISSEIFKKYNLKTIVKRSDKAEIKLCEMPSFLNGKSIPIGGVNNFMQGYLFIAGKDEISISGINDGFLGARWHAEKIINFDYLNKKMSILDSVSEVTIEGYDKLKLGFQKRHGKYTSAFASIEIKVNGEILPMLFDTGATAKLSDEAKLTLGNRNDLIGTSYIVSSIFEKWRKDHPDWKIIDLADTLLDEPMIEVPLIQIGTRLVGPVWFTRRKDSNFHDYMFSMMDKKVEGAIGGSLLQYLNIIVDYPNEMAYITDRN